MAYVTGTIITGSIPDPEVPVSASFDAGSTSNRVMKVWVCINDSGGHSPDTVTYNSVSLTADGAAVDSINTRIRGYTLAGPAAGVNDLVFTFTGGFGTPVYAICVGVWDSIDQTTPQDNYGSSTGTDGTAELTQVSAVGDTPVFCCAWVAVVPTNIAATQGWTRRVQSISGTAYFAAFGDGTGAASIDMIATLSSVSPTSWVAMGANLNATAGGSVSPVNLFMPRGSIRGWKRIVV